MTDIKEKAVAKQTEYHNPQHEEPLREQDSEVSSVTKAESDAGTHENVEDSYHGPHMSRHTRFPTQDLVETHNIEKTGTNDKIQILVNLHWGKV